ncbi:MAG TPA: mobile mystery protein A [Bacteroidia bacterium]|nr:mobile mystery protein A [Bacteroidia bacterium]
MKNTKQKLLIEQMDKKLKAFRSLEGSTVPKKGWINSVRISLNMSLRQLAQRMNISAQSVNGLEQREANGSITLNTLRDAANAMDLKLVYGLVPKAETLEKLIEKRAQELAFEIVSRTSNSMRLEDQENSRKRIEKSIRNKTEELMDKMPKYLWD